jgi:lipid-A-disaccharide synthase
VLCLPPRTERRLVVTYLAAVSVPRPRKIFVSSGEPSGELYAALLVRELRGLLPPFEAFGLGGDALAGEGVRLIAHVRDLAVVGLLEVVRHIPRLRRIFHRALAEVDRERPDLAVLVDYAGFNLRLARKLHARGVPIVYYVSPQVWAWRQGRVRTIRETVRQMLVLFPFEPAFYARHQVAAVFVGHPLVDRVEPCGDRKTARAALGLARERPLVALLPGSRRQEIRYNLPPLLGAVRRLQAVRPDLQFALAAAPNLDAAALRAMVGDLPVTILAGRATELLGAADLAVLASGTATVEAALVGTPMIVVYRVSPVSYALGKRFVKVPHYAMVNLIAGRRLVPELIQHDLTPERVSHEVLSLLSNPAAMRDVEAGLAEVRSALGERGASRRAAIAVAAVLATIGQNA